MGHVCYCSPKGEGGNSVSIRRVNSIELSQQARPGQGSALANGYGFDLRLGQAQNLIRYADEFPSACLRQNLNLTSALQEKHR